MPAKTKTRFVSFPQPNGIVCYGETIAVVSWDKPGDSVLVRYWFDPNGDPPRKPYVLIRASEYAPMIKLPPHFIRAE